MLSVAGIAPLRKSHHATEGEGIISLTTGIGNSLCLEAYQWFEINDNHFLDMRRSFALAD